MNLNAKIFEKILVHQAGTACWIHCQNTDWRASHRFFDLNFETAQEFCWWHLRSGGDDAGQYHGSPRPGTCSQPMGKHWKDFGGFVGSLHDHDQQCYVWPALQGVSNFDFKQSDKAPVLTAFGCTSH